MKFFNVFLVLAIFFSLVATPIQVVLALSSDQAYKAIVQINAYYEDENFHIALAGSGTGVIISSDGIVLTNYHVVSVYDDSNEILPSALEVCLTQDTTSKPICHYGAKIIAYDKNNDLALIKIKSIPGLDSQKSFDYLERIKNNNLSSGNVVRAIGYPAIGDNTVTITSGIITGFVDKNGLSWIKTDATVSYGSSGGALINSQGELIGIVTQANKDSLASFGYAVNINSINSWIDENINKNPQSSSLEEKLDVFIMRKTKINNNNIFTNYTVPYYSITKEDGWNFSFLNNEGVLMINNSNNSWGGSITINYSRSFWPVNEQLDLLAKEVVVMLNISQIKDINFLGRVCKKISYFRSDGVELFQIIIPDNKYAIIITYYYGQDNVDKTVIDSILNTFNITKTDDFIALHNYEHNNPYFKIYANNDWALLDNNSSLNPVNGSKRYSDLEFNVFIKKLSSSLIKADNENYFNYIKDNDFATYSFQVLGYDTKRYFEDMHYKMNSSINEVIFYKYKIINPNDNNIVALLAVFRLRSQGYSFIIPLYYYDNNEDLFNQYIEDFKDNVLANFQISSDISENYSTINDDKIINLKNQYAYKFIGRILLKVEDNGEAWYLSPKSNKAYYLGRPTDAFNVMRDQGVGISNDNLEKIPIGLIAVSGIDSDGDGLSDKFEDAVGTDKYNKDSDNDGYDDKIEIDGGWDPRQGNGSKMKFDFAFSKQQTGKIFLQVEGNGEAWYVDPKDGKRYFLGYPSDAFLVMKKLSLGISNNDFEKLNK